MSRIIELKELSDACSRLNLHNRKYVLAVANALKFAEEKEKEKPLKRKPRRGNKEDDDTS